MKNGLLGGPTQNLVSIDRGRIPSLFGAVVGVGLARVVALSLV